MIEPYNIRIEDFTYSLPEEKIAAYPAPERDSSRLLIYKGRKIKEDTYRNIADYLPDNALLIFNDTKVIPARMLFQKTTGGMIEIFLLEADGRYKDASTAMQQKNIVYWKCLVGGAARWKNGQTLQKKITLHGVPVVLEAVVTERNTDHFIIAFQWQPGDFSFSELLQEAGTMPIPPYLKREAQPSDAGRYQTVFARYEGSVAAPTAGLHFTETVFRSFEKKQIETAFISLHVGAGTFMPVKADRMKDHPMHEEWIEISEALIQQLIAYSKHVICIGTTSLRTIESIYWMGVKCLAQPAITHEALGIRQWEAYQLQQQRQIPHLDALKALLAWMQQYTPGKLVIKTQIMIAPGYSFQLVQGLVTNFHQPRSTLLLLVAALIGEEWRTVYDYALQNDFRFLSYGDGSLLFLQ